MAALLMAIYFKGLDLAETTALTTAIVNSGRRLSWPSIDRPVVDKHSTGGVGDKVSLILTPLAAAAGLAVPMFSGRGLGATGGTPGFAAQLSLDHLVDQLARVGCFIAAASSELAPADAKLYALRDATSTVAERGLIASSIMSKKIAGGASTLLIDVKVGRGALLQDMASALDLAELLIHLGTQEDVSTSVVLTEMDYLLGDTAGNAVEVREATDVLEGHGPLELRDLAVAQTWVLCSQAGLNHTPSYVERLIDTGHARERFSAMVAAQGGSPAAPLPSPTHTRTIQAPCSGWFYGCHARALGRAVWQSGAGRTDPAQAVDPTAGARVLVPRHSFVNAGDDLVVLTASDPAKLASAATEAVAALDIRPIDDTTPSSRVLGWLGTRLELELPAPHA
jgi:thymidine phosphorylase